MIRGHDVSVALFAYVFLVTDASAQEQAMIDMIRDVSDEVRALIKQGMSFDEVVAARPTSEHDNTFGDPLRFLAAVYTELGGSP